MLNWELALGPNGIRALGPIIVRVASFFPFHATYWLNGHSFIERELKRAGIGFHKNDNAFLAVDDVAALQAAADRLGYSAASLPGGTPETPILSWFCVLRDYRR